MDEIQSFYDLLNKYNTEEKCRDLFLHYIWNDGVICDKCGIVNDKTTLIRLSDKKEAGIFKCAECGKEFSIPTNCLFSYSDLTFQQWLLAIYFSVFAEKSVSSIELGKIIGVNQKEAWNIRLQIFYLLYQDLVLDGLVEMDETYVGGKEKNKHKNKQSPYSDKVVGEKIPMFGIYERALKDDSGKNKLNGRIVLQRIYTGENKKVRGADVSGFINRFISKSDNVVFFTDQIKIYTDKLLTGRRHETVKHAKANQKKDTPKQKDNLDKAATEAAEINKKEKAKRKKDPYYERYSWVTKDKLLVTTNGVENIFNHFKKYIRGTSTSVTRKYVQYYADRFCFSWNTKHLSLNERLDLFFQRMSVCDYKKVEDIKPDEETGRKSKEWRNQQRIKRGEERDLNEWLKKLRKNELLCRNILLGYYNLALECSVGELRNMGYETTYHEAIDKMNVTANILKDAIIGQDDSVFKVENCKAILEEYEHLQSIPNKRKRIAEIERREKLGEKIFDKKYKKSLS